MIDRLEAELTRLGLADERLTVRMTGCPNGCARPYNADIGLVGKAAGKYTILLGGRTFGNRLNFIYAILSLRRSSSRRSCRSWPISVSRGIRARRSVTSVPVRVAHD